MTFTLILEPADTFIVRDGTPFNQNDTGQARAHSVFPPSPDTLYGAARVALARSFGWSGEGDWGKPVNYPSSKDPEGCARTCLAALGSWNKGSAAQFCGPFLVKRGHDGAWAPLFPAPLHLRRITSASGKDASRLVALKPDDGPGLDTDMGLARLLVPQAGEDEEEHDLVGCYLSEKLFTSVLSDVSRPDERNGVYAETDIVVDERRVGLARDTENRVYEHGALYATARKRFREGMALAVEVAGLDGPGGDLPKAVPLGGEGRFAFVSLVPSSLLAPTPLRRAKRYFVTFLTPALLTGELKPESAVAGLPGRLVCAALGRSQLQGGFSAQKDRRGGIMRGVAFPVGSVLFMQLDEESELPQSGLLDSKEETQSIGYGRFAIGVW